MKKTLLKLIISSLFVVGFLIPVKSQTFFDLSSGNLSQNWTDVGLITVNDDWSGVPNIRGFLGADGTSSITGVDPQTILIATLDFDVNANQTNPNTYTSGGVTEFEITDPVVALQGSGTADFPHLVIYLNSVSRKSIRVQYDLRDIDGSADNSIQQVALQYRIGQTGDYVNIPSGYVADASTGPSLATSVIPIDITLPAICEGQSMLEVRIITTNAAGSDEWIGIDNILISSLSSTAAPIAAFDPTTGTIDVLPSIIPTITFNEPILKIDGSQVSDSDLSSLVTFKKTNAAGADVPFTAVIDANKKVITVTPAAALDNSQLFYLAVGPVENAAGFESSTQSVTFTTLSAVTPVITVTYPNGGETFYSGDFATITWTTTNFSENVKIEVWTIIDGMGTWGWITLEADTPNDGSQQVTVGPDAEYGTEYLIRISGLTNGASDVSDAPFTIISTATDLATLRSYSPGTIIKLKGEAILTAQMGFRNKKYIQDATAGILIDDSPGNITTTYNVGDGITGIIGTINLYNGMLQFQPTADPGVATSTGNAIVPQVITIAEFNTNFESYESEVVKIENLSFPSGDVGNNFVNGAEYNVELTGSIMVLTIDFFNVFTTTPIPASAHITGVVIDANGTPWLAPRVVDDIQGISTSVDDTGLRGIRIYPVPATSMVTIDGIEATTSVEVMDITGKRVMNIASEGSSSQVISIDALPRGIYFVKFNSSVGSVTRKIVKK